MTLEIITQLAAGSLVDLLFGSLTRNIKENMTRKADLNKIRVSMSKYSERYFKEKYELLCIEEEFDIQSLNEWLSDNLTRIIAIESNPIKTRTHYEYRFMEEARHYALDKQEFSNESQKKQLNVYIRGVFHIVREFLVGQITQDEKVFLSKMTDQLYLDIQEALPRLISSTVSVEIKNEVKKISDGIIENLNYRNSFEEMIDGFEDFDLSAEGFSYLNRNIGFYGRENECAALARFLDSREPVLYWDVIGQGGSGKSKLVYEYTRRKREEAEWKICYLNSTQIEALLPFQSWEYPVDLLFVIDYASSSLEALSKWIAQLQHSGKRKLRIIMIARRELTVNEQGVLVESSKGKKSCESSPVYGTRAMKVLEKKYKDTKYPGSLYLSELTENALIKLIDDYSKYEGKKELALDEKQAVINYIRYINYKSSSKGIQPIISPLYVLFATKAAVNNKNYNEWNKENLEDYIINKDKEDWQNNVCKGDLTLYKTMQNLLIFSTAATPWKRGTELPKPFDYDAQYVNSLSNSEAAKLFCGFTHSDRYNGTLLPVEPSIVGEMFVLGFLEDYFGTDFEETLIKTLWSYKNSMTGEYPFERFLYRCLTDFGKDKQVYDFLFDFFMFYSLKMTPNPHFINDVGNARWISHLLDALSYELDITLLIEDVLVRKEKYEKQPIEEDLAYKYAKSLFVLFYCQPIDRPNLCMLEELALNNPNNEEITFLYAYGLHMALGNCPEKDTDGLIDKLSSLMIQCPTCDKLAMLYALCLYVSIIEHINKPAAVNRLLISLDELKLLWIKNPTIASFCAKALNRLIHEDHGNYYQEAIWKLESIYTRWDDNEEIALEYAYGLADFLFRQDQKDEVMVVIRRFDVLVTKWSQSERISRAYSNGLLGIKCNNDGEIKSVKIERLKELLRRWPDSKLSFTVNLMLMLDNQD